MSYVEQRKKLLQLVKENFPLGNTFGFDNSTKWEKISRVLNDLGPEKSADQWRSIWKELKYSTRDKLILRSCIASLTAEGLPEMLILTDENEKVIDIVGVEGLTGQPQMKQQGFGQVVLKTGNTCSGAWYSGFEDFDQPALFENQTGSEVGETINWGKNLNDTTEKVLEQQIETNKRLCEIIEVLKMNSKHLEQLVEERCGYEGEGDGDG